MAVLDQITRFFPLNFQFDSIAVKYKVLSKFSEFYLTSKPIKIENHYKIFKENTINSYVAIKPTNTSPEDEEPPEIVILFREPQTPGSAVRENNLDDN